MGTRRSKNTKTKTAYKKYLTHNLYYVTFNYENN